MITALVLVAIARGAEPPAIPDAPAVEVRVDRRVEIISIVCHLAGFREYARTRVPSYAADIAEHFGPHRDHAAVTLVQRLRRERGISFDAPMALAVHLEPGASLRPRFDLDDPAGALYRAESRWDPASARAFLDALAAFRDDTAFEAFFVGHRDLYDAAETSMRTLLDERADLTWFGAFSGTAPTAPFTVILGLVNGGSNYGPRFIAPDGTEHMHAIIGAWKVDGAGLPDFDASFLPTIVHEFNHCFMNPLVDRNRAALAKPGVIMFPHVAVAMRRQAYGNWETMMKESLVRAGVVRYRAALEGPEAAQEQIDEEESRGFVWTGALAERLAVYEGARDEYPTLESYMPEIIAFFRDVAPTVEAMVRERNGN